MTLKEQISEDLKQAMRDKNSDVLSVLRMLSGAIRNKEIAMRESDGDVALNDTQVLETVMSEVKKRNDSVTSYLAGGRNDLADKETSEIKILEKYMPPQMSDEDIEKEVNEVIEAAGAGANFGAVMGQAMAKLKGRADGNKVSEMVKKVLGR